jgi:23S rRNA pseudouridine2605 synthase
MRLQKFLADAGVASRRHAEELIRAGCVIVNDVVIDTLPAFVDPTSDVVIANGTRVRLRKPEYYVVHKPKGVVCTNRDPGGRVRAVDLLPPLPVKLVPVGRLDVDSTGLLLMTNDGELTQAITHPRYGIAKTYHVEVRGKVAPGLPKEMKAGVHLAEGKARASDVEILHTGRDRSALRVTLREGRNRQVRRMLAKLGHPVRKLKRTDVGPLTLRGLPIGAARRLTAKEVRALHEAIGRSVAAADQAAERRRQRRAAQTEKPRKTAPRKGAAPPTSDDAGPRRRIVT